MIKLGRNNERNDREDDSVDTHNDRVQVHSIHVQPLHLLQVSVLSLAWSHPLHPRVTSLDPGLELLSLRGEEAVF